MRDGFTCNDNRQKEERGCQVQRFGFEISVRNIYKGEEVK